MTIKSIIVGAGAQGALMSYLMQKNGLTYGLWSRNGFVRANERFILDANKIKTSLNPSVFSWEGIDFLFIAVKAYDLEDFFNAQLSLIKKAKVKVVLVNGWVLPTLKNFIQKNHEQISTWRIGVSTIGVSEMEPRSYAIRSAGGGISFGPVLPALDPSWKDLKEIELEQRLKTLSLVDDIGPIIRKKWLFNTVINTLTAAYKLENNGLLVTAANIPLHKTFDEAYALGEERFSFMDFSRAEYFRDLLALIEATSENENSMARDIRLKKDSESSFLAGLADDPQKYPLLTELHKKIIAKK